MIWILNDKEDKKIAIQISKTLKEKGIENTIEENILQENITTTDTAILVVSSKSIISERVQSNFNIFFNKNIRVIPFILNSFEKNIFNNYFLDTQDWINAYQNSVTNSISDLIILLNENRQSGNFENTKSDNKKSKKILTFSLLGIGLIVLIVLLFNFLKNDKTKEQKVSKTDTYLIGSWKMASYDDNMPRTDLEQADFDKNILTLKQNFKLVFKNDNTFEKYGFGATETGNWEFDPQNEVLYMWPPQEEKNKDKLKIEKLTKDTLIVSIASQVDSLTLINTRFTLYKE